MKPLVILTGPTAVGKTKLSIALAKAINGSIISADSMQVYKGMDIGSAKIKIEEMQGVDHYLIDILEPSEEFNVTRFQKLAKNAIETILAQGKIPILVGGTGFYIQSVLYDIDFTANEENREIRERLQAIADENGPEALHDMLFAVDPRAAEAIPSGNVKRTIRALEYYELTGERISDHNDAQRSKPAAYNSAYFVLEDDRDKLYARIEARIDEMLEEGLLEEVQRLYQSGLKRNMVSMQGLGYKELLAYLDGETSLEEAVLAIKLNTRHFAKRQLTWFRRERDVIWFHKGHFDYNEAAILKEMISVLRDRGILTEA